MPSKWMKPVYEGIMLILVMITIITLWTENTYNTTINWFVWAIFVVDFIIRLINAEEKWTFVRKHPFLVIAIIPFDQFFQMARIVRVVYLFRIKTITKYYVSPYIKKLSYQSMTLIISLLTTLLLLEAVMIWWLEATVLTYGQAVQVVAGYLLFFGHHLFEIEHTIAIWTLTATSILGIIVQGIALQWLFAKLEPWIAALRRRDRADQPEQEHNKMEQ